MQKKALSELPHRKSVQNESSDIQPLEEMVNFISFSHYQMHKLVHDSENFHKKVKSIINQSKKQIDLGAYKQALSLLSEGQKILQYAAGSGKTIQRELIVCVLHNIASAYHKLWMIQKCIRYIQGLIFNLENHLNSLQNSVMSSNQKQQIMLVMQGLQMKHMLSAYYIRFCALSSQQNNHKQALLSAKKAIGYVRNIILLDQQHIYYLFRQQNSKDAFIDLKHRLLYEILEFQININYKQQRDIVKATHFSLQIWKKSKEKATQSHYQSLKTYSIGDFMDLKPKEYCSKSQMIDSVLKKAKDFEETIYYKLLLLSLSFFSTSTQLRLKQNQANFYSQIEKQSSLEIIQAQIYNLLAIILISAFLPFQILYLKHLLNSYSNYFNTELTEYKTVQQVNYQKVIQLISGNKYKQIPGSTEIISSQQFLTQLQSNQYKLQEKFMEKIKANRKNFHKQRKELIHIQNQKSGLKKFSNLETKSVVKSEKTNSKPKPSNKLESKLKCKSKPKSKSKTLEKKSKEKDKLYFLKFTSSKSKKKMLEEDLIGNLLKKVSPRKTKEGTLQKEIIGSNITLKPRKKSLLNHRIPSKKGLLAENKSLKRRNNVYGLHY